VIEYFYGQHIAGFYHTVGKVTVGFGDFYAAARVVVYEYHLYGSFIDGHAKYFCRGYLYAVGCPETHQLDKKDLVAAVQPDNPKVFLTSAYFIFAQQYGLHNDKYIGGVENLYFVCC
jgi:hypothetical protein